MANPEPKTRKERQKERREEKVPHKPFLSSRQRVIFLAILIILICTVSVAGPMVKAFYCKAACMKRVKTPYPEIACRYECPWPWQKSE